jgi:hypothetical protein
MTDEAFEVAALLLPFAAADAVHPAGRESGDRLGIAIAPRFRMLILAANPWI